MTKKILVLAFLATIVGLASPSPAHAGLQVTFGANGMSATIVDGGPGDADMSVNNQIQVNSVLVGSYTFNVTLTTTNTPGGSISFINHGTNSITGSGATTVSIVASANDFTVPTGPLDAMSGSTFQFLFPTPSGNTA